MTALDFFTPSVYKSKGAYIFRMFRGKGNIMYIFEH